MGFAYDTAITTDAMLYSYGAEQQMTNLLVEAGESDFSKIHKSAVNVLIRDLKGMGHTPANISNTRDFEAELVYWVLMTLWLSEMRSGRDGAADRVDSYRMLWEEAKASRVIETVAPDSQTLAKGLPQTMNQDNAHWFGPDNNGEESLPVGYKHFTNLARHVRGGA